MSKVRQSEIRVNVTEQAKKNLETWCIDNRVPSTTGKGSLPMSQGAALTYILTHLKEDN